MTESSAICEALSRPESYPRRPPDVAVHETHISWVFIAGDRVYKLKKPIVLDFLDYGTPERRRRMCQEEVRLNRRLAPEVYLGVRGVAPIGDGVELTDEEDPRAVDYVVEMRRYDEDKTVASRLARRIDPESHRSYRCPAGAVPRPGAASQRGWLAGLGRAATV